MTGLGWWGIPLAWEKVTRSKNYVERLADFHQAVEKVKKIAAQYLVSPWMHTPRLTQQILVAYLDSFTPLIENEVIPHIWDRVLPTLAFGALLTAGAAATYLLFAIGLSPNS